ncbi:MAG: GNAT family N-acetyltransferase [Anaerobacillus sp.]|uniref:GNAT family N-acetyltransferase n=1 Tax=Anaerobacillus sp. TaxID=1872506 RepID=UPI003918BD23
MIKVREVAENEIEKVAQFLIRTMGEVYPFPLSERSLQDLWEMKELFLDRQDAVFLAAFNDHEEVVGTLALCRYDNRIISIKDHYDLGSTCEVIKCYVDPVKRQQGIGSLLFDEALQFVQKAGYRTMYLHTHRFLPGGFTFWSKKGFTIVLDCQDEFETVHMQKDV